MHFLLKYLGLNKKVGDVVNWMLNEMNEFHQSVKNFLAQPESSLEMAKELYAFAQKTALQEVVLLLDPVMKDIRVIDIPQESLALFSFDLQNENKKQKKELESFYLEDILKACNLVITYLSQ